MRDENYYNKFKSPIPPHLSKEERAEWKESVKWERQERERRTKEGLYKETKPSGNIFGRVVRLFKNKR